MLAAKTIKEMDAEARRIAVEAKTVIEAADDHTPDEVEAAIKSLADLEPIVKRLEEQAENRKEALKTINRIENSHAVLSEAGRPHIARTIGKDGATLHGGNGGDNYKTAGQEFVESDTYQSWLKTICPNGHAPSNWQGQSPRVEVKTLYTGAADRTALGPLLGQADRREDIVRLGWEPLAVRQLISNLTTNSDLVEVVRELARTNNAAVVAEATDASEEDGEKPESAISFEVAQIPVNTIAHHIPATTRVLQDANRLRGEIDAFLRDGINAKVEDYVLNRNDSNWYGINHASGTLSQAFNTDLLTTTRKARTNLRVNGLVMPTAFVMHPNDWEDLDLTTDNEAGYYFGGPLALGAPRLWGVPVAETAYQAEGNAILGRFSDAVIYDRMSTQMFVGTVDRDFLRNIVRILAEMRAAFHVRRPKSFVKIALS